MTRLPVDAEAIRALADILVETGLTEIEIAEGDSRIRVARAPSVIQAAVAAPAMQAAAMAAPAAPEPSVTDFASHPGAVKSPMVGVVYLAPEPGAVPFIAQGQAVAAGQTLLLIEAMKTFNQIKAPRAGTVTRIFASSGVPVEYGEVLVVIE
jgi:acetyl-CoA carboxylase biotin carboxyl carrier protein